MAMHYRDWYRGTLGSARNFGSSDHGGLLHFRYLLYSIVFLPLVLAVGYPDWLAQPLGMSQSTAIGVALGAGALHLLAVWFLFGPGDEGPAQIVKPFLFTGFVGIAFLFFVQYLAADGRSVGHPLLTIIIRFVAFSYHMADSGGDALGQLIGYTLGVGLWEESIKAIPVLYLLKKHAPASWRAPCLAGLASGIGFGASEGILYAVQHYNAASDFSSDGRTALIVYLIRFVSCIGLHAVYSAAGALLLFRRDVASEYDVSRFLLRSLWALAPFMLLHGLYDVACVQEWLYLAIAVNAAAFVGLVWLIQRD